MFEKLFGHDFMNFWEKRVRKAGSCPPKYAARTHREVKPLHCDLSRHFNRKLIILPHIYHYIMQREAAASKKQPGKAANETPKQSTEQPNLVKDPPKPTFSEAVVGAKNILKCVPFLFPGSSIGSTLSPFEAKTLSMRFSYIVSVKIWGRLTFSMSFVAREKTSLLSWCSCGPRWRCWPSQS